MGLKVTWTCFLKSNSLYINLCLTHFTVQCVPMWAFPQLSWYIVIIKFYLPLFCLFQPAPVNQKTSSCDKENYVWTWSSTKISLAPRVVCFHYKLCTAYWCHVVHHMSRNTSHLQKQNGQILGYFSGSVAARGTGPSVPSLLMSVNISFSRVNDPK